MSDYTEDLTPIWHDAHLAIDQGTKPAKEQGGEPNAMWSAERGHQDGQPTPLSHLSDRGLSVPPPVRPECEHCRPWYLQDYV